MHAKYFFSYFSSIRSSFSKKLKKNDLRKKKIFKDFFDFFFLEQIFFNFFSLQKWFLFANLRTIREKNCVHYYLSPSPYQLSRYFLFNLNKYYLNKYKILFKFYSIINARIFIHFIAEWNKGDFYLFYGDLRRKVYRYF